MATTASGEPADASSGAVPPVDVPDEDESGQDAPGQATLLVSEFPPPPFYYRQVVANSVPPPAIPLEALARGTRRAAAAAARAREETERLRAGSGNDDKTNAILGGVTSSPEEEEGDVVAVFGEIVEDPLLVQPLDICEDPKVVRDEVMRLSKEVIQGFVDLIQDLVHRPQENKRRRDDLSDKIFLMLQECNKFREHQAREILIEVLEKQLEERKKILGDLETQIARADELFPDISTDKA